MAGRTFAQKFEEALAARKQREPGFGLRTLAREIADKPEDIETIRRRLHKYRPKPGKGGAGEVAPIDSTRREIERALGLEIGALAPDEDLVAALNDEIVRAKLHVADAILELQRMVA